MIFIDGEEDGTVHVPSALRGVLSAKYNLVPTLSIVLQPSQMMANYRSVGLSFYVGVLNF